MVHPRYVETKEDITRRMKQRLDHRKLRQKLFAKDPHCACCGTLLTEEQDRPDSVNLIRDTLSCAFLPLFRARKSAVACRRLDARVVS